MASQPFSTNDCQVCSLSSRYVSNCDCTYGTLKKTKGPCARSIADTSDSAELIACTGAVCRAVCLVLLGPAFVFKTSTGAVTLNRGTRPVAKPPKPPKGESKKELKTLWAPKSIMTELGLWSWSGPRKTTPIRMKITVGCLNMITSLKLSQTSQHKSSGKVAVVVTNPAIKLAATWRAPPARSPIKDVYNIYIYIYILHKVLRAEATRAAHVLSF